MIELQNTKINHYMYRSKQKNEIKKIYEIIWCLYFKLTARCRVCNEGIKLKSTNLDINIRIIIIQSIFVHTNTK